MPSRDTVATNAIRVSNLEDDMKEWKEVNKEDHQIILTKVDETNKMIKEKFYEDGYDDFQREAKAFMESMKEKEKAKKQNRTENWGFVKKFAFNALQGLLLPGVALLAYLIWGSP